MTLISLYFFLLAISSVIKAVFYMIIWLLNLVTVSYGTLKRGHTDKRLPCIVDEAVISERHEGASISPQKFVRGLEDRGCFQSVPMHTHALLYFTPHRRSGKHNQLVSEVFWYRSWKNSFTFAHHYCTEFYVCSTLFKIITHTRSRLYNNLDKIILHFSNSGIWTGQIWNSAEWASF